MENPAQSLLLAHTQPQEDARLLLLEGNDGWLGSEIAPQVPKGEVLSLSRDVREVRAAQKRLAPIPNAAAGFEVYPASGDWDLVLLTIPKERRYARTLLLAAWEALKPGGKLLLAGPTRKGAKAVITDAERLFGNVAVLGYRQHQRLIARVLVRSQAHLPQRRSLIRLRLCSAAYPSACAARVCGSCRRRHCLMSLAKQSPRAPHPA